MSDDVIAEDDEQTLRKRGLNEETLQNIQEARGWGVRRSDYTTGSPGGSSALGKTHLQLGWRELG